MGCFVGLFCVGVFVFLNLGLFLVVCLNLTLCWVCVWVLFCCLLDLVCCVNVCLLLVYAYMLCGGCALPNDDLICLYLFYVVNF